MMLTLISPHWLMAKGKKRVMERRTVLNIERHKKAFSAVSTLVKLVDEIKQGN